MIYFFREHKAKNERGSGGPAGPGPGEDDLPGPDGTQGGPALSGVGGPDQPTRAHQDAVGRALPGRQLGSGAPAGRRPAQELPPHER